MKINLTKETEQLLECSIEDKITYISQEKWINYPLAQNIIKELEDILKYEQGKTRVTSVLLVGSPHNGKTSLLEKLIKLHPPYDYYATNPEKLTEKFFERYNATGIPVHYIMAPGEPKETRLYSNILHSLNAPYRESDNVAKKQYLVEYYLKLLNVNMLIIDEIHNILSGPVAKQKQVLNAIKNLSNILKIPIVLAGTKDALRVISTDMQISSRFRPLYLKKWKMNQDYVNLLATTLSTLPMKQDSDILNPKTAQEILDISEGYIGDILGLIKKAAIYALRNQKEYIDLEDIRNCNYSSSMEANKTRELYDI